MQIEFPFQAACHRLRVRGYVCEHLENETRLFPVCWRLRIRLAIFSHRSNGRGVLGANYHFED